MFRSLGMYIGFNRLSVVLLLTGIWACQEAREEKIHIELPNKTTLKGHSLPASVLAPPIVRDNVDHKLVPALPPERTQFYGVVNTRALPEIRLSESLVDPEVIDFKNGSPLALDTLDIDPVVLTTKQWRKHQAGDMQSTSSYHSGLTRFGLLHGLNTANVQSIDVSSEGDLWLGLWNGGITRYDGTYFSSITEREGLPDNRITELLVDKNDQVWASTGTAGLIRFDGKDLYHYFTDLIGTEQRIHALFEDSKGNIWFGVNEYGLIKFDGQSFISFAYNFDSPLGGISSIMEDSEGNIWFSTHGTGIYCLENDRLTRYSTEQGLTSNMVQDIYQDRSGRIWISMNNGLCYLNNGYISRVPVSQDLATAHFRKVREDHQGHIWIGTISTGLIKYLGDHFIHYYQNDGITVNEIFQDQTDHLWIGTNNGLDRIHDDLFKHMTTRSGPFQGEVLSMVKDRDQRLWMGTERGITFSDNGAYYLLNRTHGMKNEMTFALMEDGRGELWFGTNLGLIAYDGAHFTEFPDLEDCPTFSLLEDPEGRILIGGCGLVVAERDTDGRIGKFTIYDKTSGLPSDQVKSLARDSRGNLWAGTDGGLAVLVPGRSGQDGEWVHFTEREGLPIKWVNDLFLDSRGALWLATTGGGSVRIEYGDDPTQVLMTHFNETQGLLSDWVHSVQEDDQGNMIFGTRKGLSIIRSEFLRNENESIGKDSDPPAIFKNFGFENGFLGITCNSRSIMKDEHGVIWVGTNDYLTTMDPREIDRKLVTPSLSLSEIKLFGEAIPWKDLNEKPDSKYQMVNGIVLRNLRFDSLSKWNYIPLNLELPYMANDLDLSYNGTATMHGGKVWYTQRLTGVDDKWSPLSGESSVHYGPLPPGHYTFEARAVNSNGEWSPTLRFPFSIRPPWWRTGWAYGAYMLGIIGLFFSFRKYELNRQGLKYKLELEKYEAEKLKELDVTKNRLYTNITHEFRTPLTVILGTADLLREKTEKKDRRQIELIERNGRQLLSLVNQMLDLAKLESDQMVLDPVRADLAGYIKYLIESFHSMAEAKEIYIQSEGLDIPADMDFDPGRILQIVSNLLSNAIKFTPPGGTITVHFEQEGEEVIFSVRDTGIGIDKKDLEHVFNRFYQADNSSTRRGEGTGIGLALTRELVKLMNGQITVESEKNVGSTFSVRLPVTRSAPIHVGPLLDRIDPVAATLSADELFEPAAHPSMTLDPDWPVVLVVEDNADVMSYLLSCIGSEYLIHTARNGREGIEKALDIMPDMIITDVMMPEKDGLELTATLKEDFRTSHIPIIILTARASVEDRIAGLERAADVYLTKPFHARELQIHMQNLIRSRRVLQERFRSLDLPVEEKEPGIRIEDEFLLRLQGIIESELDNSALSIDDISQRMAMSRMQLHRKIKALTDRSTSLYIRSIRLHHAKGLLEKGGLNVSEVAYAVGFDDPKYFSRVYTEEYGVPPSEALPG